MHAKWSIRAFAFVWALLVVSAAFPFMLGSVLALLALSSLQRRHRWSFALFALLTLGASPLAFILLVVVLGGVALARREERGAIVAPAAAVAAVGLLELVLRRMFPGRGSYPFSWEEFLAAGTFCLLGVALTWNVAKARLLGWTFVVYFAACSAAFAFSSPVGENIARLRVVAAPIAFLVLSLRHWRPRLLCMTALALGLAWNLTPLAASFVHSVDDPAANAAYWARTISYLQRHVPPSYRVEAVDTAGHWPADFLARARIPLVRGWFRQDDFPLNRILYTEPGRAAYLAWLRNLSVRYVVLSSAAPDYSARDEAQLLRSGRSGLKVVYRTPTTMIYVVPSPRPLVSSPARVLALGYASIKIKVPVPGNYRLGITYAPYWQTDGGCVSPTADGMTRLTARRAGVLSLRFTVTPTSALEAMVGHKPRQCR
jgi:hypothetical protein